MVQLSPICIRRNAELGAEPLVGPGIVGVLIPGIGFVPREGDFWLHKHTPRRINMEAIQTRKEGVFSLGMAISKDPAASSRASEGEIELALICHCNVSSERWVLIVGENV